MPVPASLWCPPGKKKPRQNRGNESLRGETETGGSIGSHQDVGSQSLNRLRTEAPDGLELVDRLEAAHRLAVEDDAFGLDRAYAPHIGNLTHRGLVQIDYGRLNRDDRERQKGKNDSDHCGLVQHRPLRVENQLEAYA